MGRAPFMFSVSFHKGQGHGHLVGGGQCPRGPQAPRAPLQVCAPSLLTAASRGFLMK